MDSSASNGQATTGRSSIWRHLMTEKISAFMWAVRIYAFYLCLQYLLFGSSYHMAQTFQKAMIANAVVCALRLHQRVPRFQFSRQHLALIMQEDSAHYLFYSFIFMSTHPITIALMPVGIFALLHVCNFTRQLFSAGGLTPISPMLRLLNYVAKHQNTLFRIVALNEALAFPFLVGMIFSGGAPLFSPFMYYKFMQFRYLSRRNPYSRIIFYELRFSLEHMSRSPSCPAFVGSAIAKAISLVSRMAPPTAPVNNPQQ